MKKVLIIAYHYPPLGGGGVFRTLKFTKYLPEFGFQPHVLTVKNPMYITKDPTLLREVPVEAKVYRTFSFEHRIFRAPRLLHLNLKWFRIPDENTGWFPFAVRRGKKIIKKEKIDIIYATTPINTSLLIGYLLKKETGKPLVVDYRDPWTQNVFVKYPTKFHRRIEEKMEKLVLTAADYIIVTTEPMRLKLVEKYPFIKGKIGTITNGFDSEDFDGLTRKSGKEKFIITYTGYLYGLRTGKYFFTALKELLEEKPELNSKIQVLFAGPQSKQVALLVEELRLQSVVKLLGYKSHRKSLQLMANSDVLLLIIAAEESYDERTGPLMIPGKIFEYFGAKKPILALVPQGITAEMIRSTKTGIIIPPKKTGAIKQAILKLFKDWEKGRLIVESNVLKYDRKVLTAKLAKVFQQIHESSNNTKGISE
jgi:glycosyltransferase involved in cell wall biosynthesis